MNMKTIKNLIILSAFVFGLLGANNAFAYVPGVWDPAPRVYNNEPAFYKVPVTYDAPVVPQTTTTSTTSTTTTPKKAVATSTSTTKNTTTTTNVNDARELKPIVTEDAYNNNNGLTALSLAGSGGFMPSSIWQWLMVILLILVIIIIARMLGKSHSHHEVHTVTAH